MARIMHQYDNPKDWMGGEQNTRWSGGWEGEVSSAINLAIFIYRPILRESSMAVCQELCQKQQVDHKSKAKFLSKPFLGGGLTTE